MHSALSEIFSLVGHVGMLVKQDQYTPNANMADRSVVARNELHESEASWA